MNCALYARVSTTDQNCEMQLRELRDYCTRRDWIITQEYVDAGVSGTKRSRPQLDKMMADARLHRFDCVLAWKLDRCSRSLVHFAEQIELLRSAGVRLVIPTQSIDTDENNPTARLFRNMLAAFAEFERDLIKERTAAGQHNYRELFKQGRIGKERCSKSGKNLSIGRPRVIFDRDIARQLRHNGMSVEAIAKKLGAGRGTIQRLLAANG